ncbi:hypothetical protein [Neoroseomonas soli]|uniref:Sel1 repeat family protein n=1 Tax=Neoroseomonas soli TaxID=1081025 RepID=A0A9X9WTT8_9PROT|nr:hypothetical protein [Neoroseomonas soli]MBR0670567.1 hypothetical protein [Neoroseomonas soli]
MRLAGILAVLAVAACGGSAVPPAPSQDETLARNARAGRLALELDRPIEAARLYGQALARARERDDAEAIADAATGLAAAELDRGRPREALEVARATRVELGRRAVPAPAALSLAEAVALYRLGDNAGASAAAGRAADTAGDDVDALRRAIFLRGLVAAARGDRDGLASARQSLGTSPEGAFQADARELEALTALAAGDVTGARDAAAAAAEARRDAMDYRGLSRALAIQAEAAHRAGDGAAAADLWLRAGRGASRRGEDAEARRWLMAAQTEGRRSGQPEIVDAARAELRDLEAGGDRR